MTEKERKKESNREKKSDAILFATRAMSASSRIVSSAAGVIELTE